MSGEQSRATSAAKRSEGPAKASYHHGDLRRALLDESLALVAEKGVDHLSLREVAARIGVSHAAPYHHFADKTALVAALAREGMDLLAERMRAASDAAGDDAAERLLAVGMAYVRFAEERPDYYAVFSAPELAASNADPHSMRDPGALWQTLIGAVLAAQATGTLSAGDPVVHAVHLWSLVHGLTDLWVSGVLAKMPHSAAGFDSFAEQVLRAALGSAAQLTEGDRS